eukprot:1154605-Pelagomonas_calceolata.AAC.3
MPGPSTLRAVHSMHLPFVGASPVCLTSSGKEPVRSHPHRCLTSSRWVPRSGAAPPPPCPASRSLQLLPAGGSWRSMRCPGSLPGGAAGPTWRSAALEGRRAAVGLRAAVGI